MASHKKKALVTQGFVTLVSMTLVGGAVSPLVVLADDERVSLTSHSLRTNGTISSNEKLEVKNDTILAITEKTPVKQPISYPELVEKTRSLNDITIKVQFVQEVSGIGSIISFSNSQAGNEHFHLYANGSSIGYELRGLKESADISASASGIRSTGLNTVALTTDSQSKTFKLFANGKLVSTRELTNETYRMIKDMATGVDSVTVGATPRIGNNYPFTGTLLDLEVVGQALGEEELLAYTSKTVGQGEDEFDFPHIFEATGSDFYRIPALYTLNDGTVMGAIDARFGGAADSPNNLDTAINFLDPKTEEWGKATLPLHFEDYTDEPGYAKPSASFIDPVIVQDEQDKIYMAVDAFPSGFGYPNAATGSGMKTVKGEKVLGLAKKGKDVRKWANFEYYVKDGIVYDNEDKETEYSVDEEFHLSKNGVLLYVDQKRPDGSLSGKKVPMSIFYADAEFKVYGTSYFFLVSSEDGGKTWSKPENLNYLKREQDRFWGTGPGRGHLVKVGKYAGRIIMPTYDSQDGERVSTIYSDDHGKTWKRGNRTTMSKINSPGKSSESQLIELPDGTLRLYARGSTGFIGYGDSFDGGETFESLKEDKGLAYCGNVMISVINYEGLIDGKKALIASAPEGGGRNNGIIRIGLINEPSKDGEEYTVDWKYKYAVNKGGFVYSCLTQLPNGKIALLWENDPNTKPAIYTEYTIDELKKGKSDISEFKVLNEKEIEAGSEIEVSLILKKKMVPELSDFESSHLELRALNSESNRSKLEFSSFDEVSNRLIFKGQTPQSFTDYTGSISLSENAKLFTYNGLFVPNEMDSLTVAITGKEVVETIDVEAVKLNVGALTTLKKGKDLSLKVDISPKNATNQKIDWEVEKEEIIKVSEEGLVTGLKAGTTKLTARSHNGKEASVVIRVTR